VHSAGKKGHVNYATVPNICYTHPEMASVGITEEEAKNRGLAYKTGRFMFMANSRARTVNDSEGLVGWGHWFHNCCAVNSAEGLVGWGHWLHKCRAVNNSERGW
jgi:hypothetical protein